MKLHTVTITGADDKTDPKALVDLSKEFPFAEWAILVSAKQEGGSRFPSRKWIERFCEVASGQKLKLSTHVCGRWVRDIFEGRNPQSEMPVIARISPRIQLNTHAEAHVSTLGMVGVLRAMKSLIPLREFIFQFDGVNDHIAHGVHSYGVNVSALCDTSHGAGVVPKEWPLPAAGIPTGYAGGLGPDNLDQQLDAIAARCPADYPTWVDMERRVRTEDDSQLDLKKVRKVLEIANAYINPSTVWDPATMGMP